jgi:amylosucrase
MADEPRALRPASAVRARATSALQRLQPALAEHARASLGARDAAALLARVQRRFIDVYQALDEVYGATGDLDGLMADLLRLVADAAATRDDDLRVLDHRREIAPDWHLREEQVGYVCYADRFAGSLAEVADQLDYLSGLGVTYLHLMPLLRPRPSPNDGGYAVVDYRAVDPRLGDMTDLEQLAAALRGRGISLCIDLVVNHTAREHAWARRAAAGDPVYRDYYHVFGDRSLPDRYSATLPEVFPDTAPGSFTEVPGLGWVWTTFHDYQWDLNYANPRVFREMLDVMLFLANRGVEVLRLDAVPFLWKREGTACLNEPEVHSLLQASGGSSAAPRRRWSSRPRRSLAPTSWSATSGSTTGTARSASSRTTTSSW